MSHVHRSLNQVVPSHCNIANGTVTSISHQPNMTAMFQPHIQLKLQLSPNQFQLANPAMPHSSMCSTAKCQPDETGQSLSSKYKKVCVLCSGLDMMSGYRRATVDKVYFDPFRLKLSTLFSCESFFTACATNVKDWLTFMCHTARVVKYLLAFIPIYTAHNS